jgi:hypothetical protein
MPIEIGTSDSRCKARKAAAGGDKIVTTYSVTVTGTSASNGLSVVVLRMIVDTDVRNKTQVRQLPLMTVLNFQRR